MMIEIQDEIVALDVETTGLDSEKDRIVEIALIRIKQGSIVEKLVTLLNPEIKIPPDVSLIHGITDEQIKDAPFFRDIAVKVLEIINQKTILVHNADFDIPFLKKELKLCGLELSEIKIIDTLAIARNNFCFTNNSLSTIASYYKIDTSGYHRAEADAMMTYKIYCKLLEELQKKGIICGKQGL
ncbi:MAG: 3'-5' exonuclease [Candidatus Omnitrophica bacterium]|nr:3'-5' exonuclease [Candidatus Omnitrophota bacterium]MCM8777180.1 3'-5' exonuclease [Candidatus Omnitrophota bacterium]